MNRDICESIMVEEKELAYLFTARTFDDQFPNQHSEKFTLLNYGTDVYLKVPGLLRYAENYIGTDKFDQIMKLYYKEWKFKHPYPEDFQKIWTLHSPKKMDWLFEGFLGSNKKMDYSISKRKERKDSVELTIRNNEKIAAPIEISLFKDTNLVYSFWYDGSIGSKKVTLASIDFDQIILDPHKISFELYRNNNTLKQRSLFSKTEPLRFSVLPFFDQSDRTDIGVTPVIGRNSYNQFMLGLHLSPAWFPMRNYQLSLTPLYDFTNQTIAGYGKVSFTKYFAGSRIHDIRFGLNFKRFAYDKKEVFNKALNYHQFTPYISLKFNTPPSKYLASELTYKLHIIQDEIIGYNVTDSTFSINNKQNIIHDVSYKFQNPFILSPFSLKAGLRFENYRDVTLKKQHYLRTDLEINKSIRYLKKRYIEGRVFTSVFLINTARSSSSISSRNTYGFTKGSVGLAYQGYLDDSNDELFIGRSDVQGIWARQIFIRQGGFKLAHGIPQRDNLGNSNSFVWAVNLSADLPFKYIGTIIRPYVDLGYFHHSINNSNTPESMLVSGGINLRIFRDYVNIYFPIYHSRNIRDLYNSIDQHNYLKQITFSLQWRNPTINELIRYFSN